MVIKYKPRTETDNYAETSIDPVRRSMDLWKMDITEVLDGACLINGDGGN
jgi:hypothetical protein